MVEIPPHDPNRNYQNGFPEPHYPGSIPPYAAANPENVNGFSGDKKEMNPWVKVGIASVAVIATAVVGSAGLAYYNAKQFADGSKKMLDGGAGVSAPVVSGQEGVEKPTLDSATVEQFYDDNNFTDEQRVGWADSQLNSPSTDPEYPDMTVEQAAYRRINANFRNRLGSEFSGLVKPSVNNSPAEVDTQIYVDTAAALFEPNLNKAKKMFAAVADNGSTMYDSLVTSTMMYREKNPGKLYDQTESYHYTPWDSGPHTPADKLAPQATGISSSSPLGPIHPIDNTPTRIAMQHTSQDNDRASQPDFEVVRAFVGGKRWIEREIIRLGDSGKWIPPEELVTIQPK